MIYLTLIDNLCELTLSLKLFHLKIYIHTNQVPVILSYLTYLNFGEENRRNAEIQVKIKG